ncbi:hypothetical protein GQ44DRAFT_729596 [Phaeosphaeriaceae sp. PMI808]|nr:hypothetical protein GQ44DRAFT_729596 [Phaeosphaeriaceae sp. PMI808]
MSPSLPPPTFTPNSLIDLSTKVYIISSPTDLALAEILYNLHATVYIGAISLPNYNDAVSQLTQACPDSKGTLKSFIWNDKNLHSINLAVQKFLTQEWRLDVLFLNTDIPQASDISSILLPSFLLATLLLPILHTTASHFCHPNPSIRIVWSGSSAPVDGIYFNEEFTMPKQLETLHLLYLLAYEFSSRGHTQGTGEIGINVRTLPNSNYSGVQHITAKSSMPGSKLKRLIRRLVPFSPQDHEYEGYTLLYAGLSPDTRSGDWVIPWGRKSNVPEHVRACLMVESGEEKGFSARLYAWCEINAKLYL